MTFLTDLGPGGLSSLTLAFASGLVALGVPVGLRLRQVLRAARSDDRRPAEAILILGRELVDDRPTAVFRARLDHGAALWRAGLSPRLLISGGWTGNAIRSEAAAGRQYLIEAGVPEAAIETEERSRHTLENLYFVRESLRARGLGRIVLVTDPLHLARATALARGLSLDFACSPAVTAPPRPGAPAWWVRALREAFLLHWYHVGVAYSRAIGSERLLARVS